MTAQRWHLVAALARAVERLAGAVVAEHPTDAIRSALVEDLSRVSAAWLADLYLRGLMDEDVRKLRAWPEGLCASSPETLVRLRTDWERALRCPRPPVLSACELARLADTLASAMRLAVVGEGRACARELASTLVARWVVACGHAHPWAGAAQQDEQRETIATLFPGAT